MSSHFSIMFPLFFQKLESSRLPRVRHQVARTMRSCCLLSDQRPHPSPNDRTCQIKDHEFPDICEYNWYSDWWFGTCFIVPYIDNNPNWRTYVFQRGRYTTNQTWIECEYINVNNYSPYSSGNLCARLCKLLAWMSFILASFCVSGIGIGFFCWASRDRWTVGMRKLNYYGTVCQHPGLVSLGRWEESIHFHIQIDIAIYYIPRYYII